MNHERTVPIPISSVEQFGGKKELLTHLLQKTNGQFSEKATTVLVEVGDVTVGLTGRIVDGIYKLGTINTRY
jgi:hypothetical protein